MSSVVLHFCNTTGTSTILSMYDLIGVLIDPFLDGKSLSAQTILMIFGFLDTMSKIIELSRDVCASMKRSVLPDQLYSEVVCVCLWRSPPDKNDNSKERSSSVTVLELISHVCLESSTSLGESINVRCEIGALGVESRDSFGVQRFCACQGFLRFST